MVVPVAGGVTVMLKSLQPLADGATSSNRPAVWTVLPAVAFTCATTSLRATAVQSAVTVRVALEPAVIDVLLNVAVTCAGRPETESVSAAADPLVTVVLTVTGEPAAPAVMV